MIYADYSGGRLLGSQVKAAGYGGTIRYLGTPGRAKNATRAEVQSQLASGIAVHGVYELGTTDWAGGYNAGVANAKALLADANACGVPSTSALFVAADMHLTASQAQTFRQYVLGAKSVLGSRTGAYGFSEALAAVSDLGVYGWCCGSASTVPSWAHVYQRNSGYGSIAGVSTDINDVLRPISATTPVAVAPVAKPKTPKDESMLVLIYTDAKKVCNVALNIGGIFYPLSAGPANNAHTRAVTNGELPWLALTVTEWNDAITKSNKLLGA